MLCQKCNHNNATVHFEQNINGKVTKMDLCPECAKELGIGSNMSFSNHINSIESIFDNFFSGMFQPVGLSSTLSCNSCGEDMTAFSNSGFLGCADCYDVFDSIIENSLSRCQRGVRHTGKRPNRLGFNNTPNNTDQKEKDKSLSEIDKLRSDLNEAIKAENYEKAAELRDKIKAMENNK